MGTALVPETLNRVASTNQDLKGKLETAERDFQKLSQNAGARVGEMASELKSSASEYVETGRTYVREHPGKSVAIAAAAGLVAGSLFTLVMSRRK